MLPLWQQKKMLDVFPDIRFELVEGAGHVVYLEKKDVFFPMLKAFMRAKATDFEMPRTLGVSDDRQGRGKGSIGQLACLVALYATAIIVLVVRGARRNKSVADYAVGNIAFSPVAVGLALAASTTSAATFIINPGLVAYFGLSAVFALCVVLPISMFVSLVVLTKGFRKYGDSVKALTLSQWVGERFESRRLRRSSSPSCRCCWSPSSC